MNHKDLSLLQQIKSRRLERQKRELIRQSQLVSSLSDELDAARHLEAQAKQAWGDERTSRLTNLLSSPMFVATIEQDQKQVSVSKQSWLDQSQCVQEAELALKSAEDKLEEDSLRVNRLLKENEKFSYLCNAVLQTELRKGRAEPVN